MTDQIDGIGLPAADDLRAADGALRVPPSPVIPVARGDHDSLIPAVRRVLDAAAAAVGREIRWLHVQVGDRAIESRGRPVPAEAVRALRRCRLGLVGPLGSTRRATRRRERTLRNRLGLMAALERSIPMPGPGWSADGDAAPNLTVVRDITEDAYAGIGFDPDVADAASFAAFLRKSGADVSTLPAGPAGYSVRPVSRAVTESLVERAIEHALDTDARRLTVVHQGDLARATEDRFREWARSYLATEYPEATLDEASYQLADCDGSYPDDEVLVGDRYTDEAIRELVTAPGNLDVVVTPGLPGRYLSDLAAALGGGYSPAGVAVGDARMIAPASFATAVPRTDDGRALDPVGPIGSGALLFERMDWTDAAAVTRDALSATLSAGIFPPGSTANHPGSDPSGHEAFAAAVVDRIESGDATGSPHRRTTPAERAAITALVAGLHNIVLGGDLSPRDVVLNQLLAADEEADISFPAVGLNLEAWRSWGVERRMEVLLHELAHVDEGPDEPDHGDAFYERLVDLTGVATDRRADLAALFGSPIDVDRLRRHIVESVHEETIEPEDDVAARQRMLRARFGLAVDAHFTGTRGRH